MKKLLSRLGAIVTVTVAAGLLSGCYVSAGPSYRHHPPQCRKVERVNRVCVRGYNGHCKRFKTTTTIDWSC